MNLSSSASFIGEEEVLSQLTKHHSAFEEADRAGWLPLHKAAVQPKKKILEVTLEGTLLTPCAASEEKCYFLTSSPVF